MMVSVGNPAPGIIYTSQSTSGTRGTAIDLKQPAAQVIPREKEGPA